MESLLLHLAGERPSDRYVRNKVFLRHCIALALLNIRDMTCTDQNVIIHLCPEKIMVEIWSHLMLQYGPNMLLSTDVS